MLSPFYCWDMHLLAVEKTQGDCGGHEKHCWVEVQDEDRKSSFCYTLFFLNAHDPQVYFDSLQNYHILIHIHLFPPSIIMNGRVFIQEPWVIDQIKWCSA